MNKKFAPAIAIQEINPKTGQEGWIVFLEDYEGSDNFVIVHRGSSWDEAIMLADSINSVLQSAHEIYSSRMKSIPPEGISKINLHEVDSDD